jgi:murein DD-endopeptidase MepM/ murein hydrolase activator NlpD
MAVPQAGRWPWIVAGVLMGLRLPSGAAGAAPPAPTRLPLVRVVDLNVGDTQEVELCSGKKVKAQLLDLKEHRDPLREAVRLAQVQVKVDGQPITLTSGNYRLPQIVASVRIDCPITEGYRDNSNRDVWGLLQAARLRLWPADSPLQAPGTFVYPAKQRWFASATQMANEPVFVDGGENPLVRRIYYHYGLDIGGAEGMVEVVAGTDGRVVSAGTDVLPGYQDTPVQPRYDVIYLLDDQGWYYRYSHLQNIEEAIKPGRTVQRGQKLGVLGKEGASGGWSHLHFDITSRQPSGKWGIQEGYAFLWEAYQAQYRPEIQAVARPHHLVWAGQAVMLDGRRSWTAGKAIERYEWTFADGTTATGETVQRLYAQPGSFSEILKVVDDRGRHDYDFAVVQVLDREHPERLSPTMHAAYAPTFGLRPGDAVTFKVRSFRTTVGEESWDFGDGTAPVTVRSDGNVKPLAKDGYAVTTHRYAKAGHYLVRVERRGAGGSRAVAHLHVRVGDQP